MAICTAFDDVRTKALGDAFDAVCGKLHGTSYPDKVREAIADRLIIIASGSTEQDPQRLADAVVTSLGIKL
jgi:hypothetical protein